MKHALFAFIAVLALALVACIGALQPATRFAIAVVVPVASACVFLGGIAWRVFAWAKSPVPFRIPLTAGQQASFAWLKPARLENPSTMAGAIGRMALEVLLFRSLVRNVSAEIAPSGRLIFREGTGLWLASLAFHYSLLVIVLRHLRLVMQPVPGVVSALAAADSFFQVGIPAVYATDVVLAVALGYLLVRRVREPQLRCLSLFSDYLPLFLLLGAATTGVLLRYFVRVDVVAVKELALSLVTLSTPNVAASLHPLVFAHLALVSALVASFPFTKLMHMAGVFLSPTRNLANNNRAKRHVNPWNAPVKVHTYQEWEDEFREKMIAAGVPVEGSADHV
jgi:nitrate reductase gamma subunit